MTCNGQLPSRAIRNAIPRPTLFADPLHVSALPQRRAGLVSAISSYRQPQVAHRRRSKTSRRSSRETGRAQAVLSPALLNQVGDASSRCKDRQWLFNRAAALFISLSFFRTESSRPIRAYASLFPHGPINLDGSATQAR